MPPVGAPQAQRIAPGILPRWIEGFILAGDNEASLRLINGGRRCVDAQGREPPGWQINGSSLDLTTCAKVARSQKSVVGFRWGRAGFSHSSYVRHVHPEGSEDLNVAVDLNELFSGNGTFMCNIYMIDENGHTPQLDLNKTEESATARRLAPHPVVHQHHKASANHRTHNRWYRDQERLKTEGVVKISQTGDQVCLQRRSLLRFYDIETTEMWFCYLPEERWPGCEHGIKRFYIEGLVPLMGAFTLVTVLAFVMQRQWHFMWALSWVASFVVSLELGVASVALLLKLGADIRLGLFVFEAVALSLVVVGTGLAMLPHRCRKILFSCPVPVTAYLLTLVTLPCFTLDLMSYWSTFPLLVDHWPVMLGLLGFCIDGLLQCVLGEATVIQSGLGRCKLKDVKLKELESSASSYEYQVMRLTD